MWGKLQQFFGRTKDPQEKWRDAMASLDEEKAIKDLLQIQRQLLEDRAQYTQFYQSFIDDFLNFLGRLPAASKHSITAADLQYTEVMIFTLAELVKQPDNMLSIWRRLSATLYKDKQESELSALVMRIYYHPTTSPVVKGWCVTQLVGQNMLERQHLTLYLHYLSDPNIVSTDKAQLIQFLGQVCTIRYNAPVPEIKKAAFIARSLAANQLEYVPGVSTTLGIAALQVEQTPAQALKHFQQALHVNIADREARLGLLLAALQQQDYAATIAVGAQWKHPLDPEVMGLLRLVQVLHWLNDRNATGTVPTTAQELGRHMQNIKDATFSPLIQPLISLALAHLHILEGNSHEAICLLEGIQPDARYLHTYYYLAWAYTLTNNSRMVLRCLTDAKAWNGSWTIACLLLGLDQELAKQHGIIEQHVDNRPLLIPDTYVPVFNFRIAQTCLRAPAKMRWTIGVGQLEEDLEALRSKLGHAFYTHDLSEMDTFLSMPLFQRLPVADRQTWQALRLLEGNEQAAQKLLEEVVEKYHYRRASVILAIHLLRQGQQKRGWEIIRQLEPPGPRFDLLQAYEDLSARKLTTTQQLLQKQDTHYEARAYYLLGNFYLQQAKDAQQRRDCSLARKQSEGALIAFEHAQRYRQMGYVLPDDHQIYEDYAHAIANNPGTAPESANGLQQNTDPQIVWETLLCQLFAERATTVAAACETLLNLLPQAQKLEDAFIITLSKRIAFCCKQAENVEQGEKMVHILQYLVKTSDLPEVHNLYLIGMTQLARLRYTQASDTQREQVYAQTIRQAFQQQQNFPLALLTMKLHLCHNKLQAAMNVLKRTPSDNPFASYVQACLTTLLTTQRALIDKPAATQLPQAQQQATHLLDVLVHLAHVDDEQRYLPLLSTLPNSISALSTIILPERLFLALYMYYQETGKPFHELFTNFASLLPTIANKNLLVNLPRQLASTGKPDQASILWEFLLQHLPEPPALLYSDYVYFLEYQAVGAYKNGNYQEAADNLQRVLSLHTTHAQSSISKVDAPTLKEHCRTLKKHAALQRLLVHLGYGKQPYVPGRFNVFSSLFDDSPFFYQALLVGKDQTIAHEWRLVQACHASNVKYLHALAIIYQELAEYHAQAGQDGQAQLSHALWALLFRSNKFWDYLAASGMKNNPSEQETRQRELLSKVLEKTLNALTTAGKQAFMAQQYQQAQQYLINLSFYMQADEELHTFIGHHGLVCRLNSSPELKEQVSRIATRYLDRWRGDVMQQAEKILTNAEAIQKQAEGIRKNYAESISYLTSFARLGFSSTFILYQCIEQALSWSDDIYIQRETRREEARKEISAILDMVAPEVQLLTQLCERDRGDKFKPEIKALADYYYYRAQSTVDHEKARIACNMALSWLPDHVGTSRVKRDIEWDLFSICLEEVIVGVEQKRPKPASFEKGFAHLEALGKMGFDHYALEKARALYIFYVALSYDILGRHTEAETRVRQALEIAGREFSGEDVQIKDSMAKYLQTLQQKLWPGVLYQQYQYSPQVKRYLEQARKDSAEKKYGIAAKQYEKAIGICTDEKAQQNLKRELAIVLNAHGEKVLEAIRLDQQQGKPIRVRLAEARKLFKNALNNDPTQISALRNLERIDREF